MFARTIGLDGLPKRRLDMPVVSSRSPSRRCSIGTRNTSPQINAATGIARDSKYPLMPKRPWSKGFPGRMAIFQK